jgi:arylsulfatase A
MNGTCLLSTGVERKDGRPRLPFRITGSGLLAVSLLVSTLLGQSARAAPARLPNVVVILADDLGYGDVACYNPKSKIPTPNLDKLATQGMRFTDAHSASTVCTPSRYSLLTGRMCFRTGLRGVFTGADGPLIERGRLTLPGLLRKHHYRTAAVGKWHVGMTFLKRDGKPVAARGGGLKKVLQIDPARPIQDGPTAVGFDYFFGTACCPTTDWLYAFIENDRFVQAPTERVKPTSKNWLEYDYFRAGLKARDFDFRTVDLTFLDRSVRFLESHVRQHPDRPFFLYHATQTAHLPALPAKAFVGKTRVGPLGDFIFEFDHIVGELMKTLERLGVAENTLVIVTSDNGPEIVITRLREQFGHDSAYPWRGMKRDNWEGGHRVPFIARWPGRIKAGSTNDQTICLTDILATCAGIVGAKLPPDAAEDSYNILPLLLGEKRDRPVREYTLHQTIRNSLGIRSGAWKLLDHKGSGGNNYDQGSLAKYKLPEKDPAAPGQLYDLTTDPGETNNIYRKHPEIVKRLKDRLDHFQTTGRSARRAESESGTIEMTILDGATGKPVPCRVHLKDTAGKPQRASGLPFWRDHFVCPGTVRLELPPGKYTFEVERGHEYRPSTGSFTLAAKGSQKQTVKLERLVDLSAEGWWSGDLHIHRPVEDIELLMKAEDLHIGPVITWWNKRNLWATRKLPSKPLVRFDGSRFYHLLAGEDEREGGALLFFDLPRPLAITEATREYPSPMRFVEEARRHKGVWIDIEKPFWWDVPVWLASGQVDSIGLANNHMCRDRMYETEAWGKPRIVERLPAPLGNGYWTQEIYYHLLNSGLRVPPSAGSASGVLPNPVGYDRVYVHVGKELTWAKWWEGLRAGHSFVTNGPLLRAEAAGKLPGHVFREKQKKEVAVEVRVKLTSHDPIRFLEVVKNGEVERRVPFKEWKKTGTLGTLRFRESGWFLVRVIADNPKTFRFASTGPWYVEVGEQKRISRSSARFFLDWVRERMKRVKLDDARQREEVLRYQQTAEKFWADRLKAANAR